tara:strand:- start:51 stop:404 length:354 start_codon:yes stop_codon:yes gene_type:complete
MTKTGAALEGANQQISNLAEVISDLKADAKIQYGSYIWMKEDRNKNRDESFQRFEQINKLKKENSELYYQKESAESEIERNNNEWYEIVKNLDNLVDEQQSKIEALQARIKELRSDK